MADDVTRGDGETVSAMALPDARVREWWRSVQGPYAELNGPLIRFAALLFRQGAEVQLKNAYHDQPCAVCGIKRAAHHGMAHAFAPVAKAREAQRANAVPTLPDGKIQETIDVPLSPSPDAETASEAVKHGTLGVPLERRREPTERDFADPRFDVLWELMKRVDVDYRNGLFSGATGNDVCAVLDALDEVGLPSIREAGCADTDPTHADGESLETLRLQLVAAEQATAQARQQIDEQRISLDNQDREWRHAIALRENVDRQLAQARRELETTIFTLREIRAQQKADFDRAASAESQLAQARHELEQERAQNPKRVCNDCGEVFEWHQVDDVGRCARCYDRFVRGEPRLWTGAVHPDKRYVPASALQRSRQALTTLCESATQQDLSTRDVVRRLRALLDQEGR
jgi:hypothetical protein